MFSWFDLDSITAFAGKIPFFILAQDTGQISVKLSMQRMIEAVLIGATLAVIGYLAILPRLSERMENIQISVERIEGKQDKEIRDLRALIATHMDGHPSRIENRFNDRFEHVEKRLDRLEEQ